MIKAVVKQDLQELYEHLDKLRVKYGPDFFLCGFVGIECDEIGDTIPVFENHFIIGNIHPLIRGTVRMLGHAYMAFVLLEALKIHSNNELGGGELRDKFLDTLRDKLVEIAQEKEDSEAVEAYLKSLGLS